jgi:hypothetical protein
VLETEGSFTVIPVSEDREFNLTHLQAQMKLGDR